MSIYIANSIDPFVIGLQNFPNPEIPKDASRESFGYIGELNPFYGMFHSEETIRVMREKRISRYENGVVEGMMGKNHTEETRKVIKQKAIEQFSDPKNREVQRQKALKQFKDPEQRYKAGNGKRGKSWYCNHETGHTILCFPCDKPDNYVKGRIYK
jgi:hypothetical protein